MKKLVFTFFLLSSLAIQAQTTVHFPVKIGGMFGAGTKITANAADLKTQWEAALMAGGSGTVINIDIATITISADAAGHYILYASSADGKVKTSIPLVLQDNFFYEKSINGGCQIVVCTGTVNGCKPENTGTADPYCTPCIVPDNANFKCGKTVMQTDKDAVFKH